MLNRQKLLSGSTPDTLCRRVWSDQFGIPGFQPDEIPHQCIVCRIRNRRLVQDVIAVIVPFNLCAKSGDLLTNCGSQGHTGFLRMLGACVAAE